MRASLPRPLPAAQTLGASSSMATSFTSPSHGLWRPSSVLSTRCSACAQTCCASPSARCDPRRVHHTTLALTRSPICLAYCSLGRALAWPSARLAACSLQPHAPPPRIPPHALPTLTHPRQAEAAASIGLWETLLQFESWSGVLINCMLISISTDQVQSRLASRFASPLSVILPLFFLSSLTSSHQHLPLSPPCPLLPLTSA